MTANLFNQKHLNQRRARARKSFAQFDFLHTRADAQIQDRLRDINRTFTATQSLNIFDDALNNEILPYAPRSQDLITAHLNLHTINDLPGMLIQIRRALKPDGLFLGAMFGGETLFELRETLNETEMEQKGGISPRVFPFADKQQMGGLLQRAGFALPVVDSEILTVTYENLFKLIRDLRGMAETNIITARDTSYVGKNFFPAAAQKYAKNHSDPGGRIRASFEIIYLIGWSPHESQQKPLKPGSAETRLADALGTKEQ